MKLTDYRYAPHNEETKVLCAKLEDILPNVKFKFLVQQDGMLRMRATRTKPTHKDMELLLREQTPDQVVAAFVTYFESEPTPATN